MTAETRAAEIEGLIKNHIEDVGCGDPECTSCKFGIALGSVEAGEPGSVRLDHIDEAYNQGHRDGFRDGKLQRDHDIKRAVEEIQKLKESLDMHHKGKLMYENAINLIKKYTEA